MKYVSQPYFRRSTTMAKPAVTNAATRVRSSRYHPAVAAYLGISNTIGSPPLISFHLQRRPVTACGT